MDEFDYDEDGVGEVDVVGFCHKLEEAWGLVNKHDFSDFIELVFNGYNLKELTMDDMSDMLDEFIVQNR